MTREPGPTEGLLDTILSTFTSVPLTCCGHSNNFTPAAGPADVDCSHRDEVTASCLQLDQTPTGGHGYNRPEGLTNETEGCYHFYLKYTKCTMTSTFWIVLYFHTSPRV